jgi:hypothetical protein
MYSGIADRRIIDSLMFLSPGKVYIYSVIFKTTEGLSQQVSSLLKAKVNGKTV